MSTKDNRWMKLIQKKPLYGIAAAFALAATVSSSYALDKKALVIMLDGMRSDTVENAHLPNIKMLQDGKWQQGYKCAWSLTANTILDTKTVSGPNHIAIASGITFAKHRVPGNGKNVCDFKKWPSWLSRLVAAKPEMKALFMYSWRWDKSISPDPKVEFIHGSDADNMASMPGRLTASDAPDAVMWFIDLPDHGGHGFGYYPSSTGYLNTMYECDKAIGNALAAIASRPSFSNEDWLIIVVSDHGGYHRTHGLMNGQATTIPLMVTGRNVRQGRMPGTPHNYDVAPTALAHFGIDASGMDLDGQIVGGKVVSDKPRALSDGLVAYLPFDGKFPENIVKGGPTPAALGTNATLLAKGGHIGGCLGVDAAKGACGVRLKGTEKMVLDGGKSFAFVFWSRIPKLLDGDPAMVGNKNWVNGRNHGVVVAVNKKEMIFNGGIEGGRRIDLKPYDVECGKWTFYAVTCDGDGVLRFYQGGQDGRLYWLSENAGRLAVASGLPFCIGTDGTGAYKHKFSGDIDEFALWTRSLSHEDVRRIYRLGLVGVPLLGAAADPRNPD